MLYARVSDFDKIVDSIIDASIERLLAESDDASEITDEEIAMVRLQVEQMFAPMSQKINNQWMRFPLEEMSQDNEEATCLLDTFKKLSTDSDVQRQMADIYSQNNFLVVSEEVGERDGSVGYRVSFDSEQISSFADEVKSSDYGQQIIDCGSSELDEVESAQGDDIKDYNLVLWVNRASSTLTGVDIDLVVDGDEAGDTKAEVKLDFVADGDKSDENIVAPEGAQDWEVVLEELMVMMLGAGPGSSPTFDTQSSRPVNPLSI